MSSPVDSTPQAQIPPTTDASGVSRRGFLGGAGAAAAGMAAGTVTVEQLLNAPAAAAALTPAQRRTAAYNCRVNAATYWKNQVAINHPVNGDEAAYPNRIGNYSKSMPHNSFGEVNPAAYQSLLTAIDTGSHNDYSAMILSPGAIRQTSPQCGMAFDMEGVDSHAIAVAAPPALASRERAGELIEKYWMSLLRDVDFRNYAGNATALAACADLNTFGTDFKGPKIGGAVTPQTLFRDTSPGCTTGPYISQFMWLPTPFGAEYVERKTWTYAAGVDHMMTFADWLAVQNGFVPGAVQTAGFRRFMINARDVAAWVHVDVLFQAYFNACLIMMTPPDNTDVGGGIGVPFNVNNPYVGDPSQNGFCTFGPPAVKTLVCEVASRCLKATWHKKWQVHRTLRPEAMAGRVHVHSIVSPGRYNGALHPSIFSSSVLSRIQTRTGGSLLLPMAFPEGSPTHPSYTAGHATVAGACITILKALFDTENRFIQNPMEPTPDGSGLQPYTGPALTVEGELNKCASNIATGRNLSGVHWRSDSFSSMRIGQAVAISVLRDQRLCYNEGPATYNFRGFDGERIIL